MVKIVAAKKILLANDRLAEENRRVFSRAGLFTVNLVGSPGCGKTTLLESLFAQFSNSVRPAVIEGDLAGQVDADRLAEQGVEVVQINTEGMCHLEAGMIADACDALDLEAANMLWIENVGNLVCTAGYDLGEHLRLVVLSVSEGDDKVVKYPTIFQRSGALLITKTDLQPYCKFDAQRVRADMKRLAPEARLFEVSATQSEGVDELAQWILQQQRQLTVE